MDKSKLKENSLLMSVALEHGGIVEDSGEYEQYYSDAPGGEFTRLKIINYDGKLYVYKEKITEDRQLNKKSECVAFYELKCE